MDSTIGKRIKSRRNELGITQSHIQKQSSISTGNLSGIENGRYLPSAIALIELSKILDCSIDWILTGNSLISNTSDCFDIKDSNITNLLTFFNGMNQDDQKELLMIAQMKYEKQNSGRATTSSLSQTGKINIDIA